MQRALESLPWAGGDLTGCTDGLLPLHSGGPGPTALPGRGTALRQPTSLKPGYPQRQKGQPTGRAARPECHVYLAGQGPRDQGPRTHVTHSCQLLTKSSAFQRRGCLLRVDPIVIHGELSAHEVGPAGQAVSTGPAPAAPGQQMATRVPWEGPARRSGQSWGSLGAHCSLLTAL